jgi:hypothetical protein
MAILLIVVSFMYLFSVKFLYVINSFEKKLFVEKYTKGFSFGGSRKSAIFAVQ